MLWLECPSGDLPTSAWQSVIVRHLLVLVLGTSYNSLIIQKWSPQQHCTIVCTNPSTPQPCMVQHITTPVQVIMLVSLAFSYFTAVNRASLGWKYTKDVYLCKALPSLAYISIGRAYTLCLHPLQTHWVHLFSTAAWQTTTQACIAQRWFIKIRGV